MHAMLVLDNGASLKDFSVVPKNILRKKTKSLLNKVGLTFFLGGLE